jgi:hypothetical protein
MADKSPSPFAGLDKALLRSTKQSPHAPPQKDVEQDPKPDTVIPRHHDTALSTMPPRNHDTVVAHADDILDVVRKAVRQIGKEAATHRFTLEADRK